MIYVFGQPGVARVKIGVSRCPRSRMVNLRGEHDMPKGEIFYMRACKVDARAAEAYVHRKLDDYRLDGEWFLAPLDVVVAAIDEAAALSVIIRDVCPRRSALMKRVWVKRRERYGPRGRPLANPQREGAA